MKKEVFTQTHIALLAVLLIVVGVNFALLVFVAQEPGTSVNDSGALEAIVVVDQSCARCVNASAVVESLSQFGVSFERVQEVERMDADALVREFNLERFPAIVVRGEDAALEEFGVFERVGDAWVWRDLGAPYVDADGSVRGIVDALAIVDSTCEVCTDPSNLLAQLATNGMVFDRQDVVDTSAAADVIAQYQIERVPSLILSKEASAYGWLNASWPSLGSVEADESLVLRKIPPPFVDLASDEVRGVLELIMIENSSCAACVPAQEIARVFAENFGLVYGSNESVAIDSPRGRALMARYNISRVPTVLLVNEALLYPAVNATWSDLGSVESDGMLVLRNLDVFG